MPSPVRSLSPEPRDYTFDTDPAPVRVQKGDAEDNTLVGDEGRDRLFGLGGDDTLVAKGSRDYLEGGDGDDRLSGGGDGMLEDRFAFDRDDGSDFLTDFVPQCEVCIAIFPNPEGDRLVLLDGKPGDIAAVAAGVTESPEGDAVLHYGETSIQLDGVPVDRVSADMFVLG